MKFQRVKSFQRGASTTVKSPKRREFRETPPPESVERRRAAVDDDRELAEVGDARNIRRPNQSSDSVPPSPTCANLPSVFPAAVVEIARTEPSPIAKLTTPERQEPK